MLITVLISDYQPCADYQPLLIMLSPRRQVSYNDVPQLIKMIGPEPGKFRGKSQRTDELITELETRLARVQM